MLSQMASLPKRLAGGLARLRRTEEEVKKSLERTLAGFRVGHCAIFCGLRILCRLASARAGAHQDEAPEKGGMLQAERLRDVAADREPENINHRNAERPDKVGGVLTHRLNG